MLELFKKSIYATIGLAVLTREKVEELGKRLASEAKMTEAEGREFINELLKKSDETKEAIEKMVNQKVEATLKKLKIPTRAEFSELESRICKLEMNVFKDRKESDR
jgi:polyhydroxyalkanoate synthesis regulator phasin